MLNNSSSQKFCLTRFLRFTLISILFVYDLKSLNTLTFIICLNQTINLMFVITICD